MCVCVWTAAGLGHCDAVSERCSRSPADDARQLLRRSTCALCLAPTRAARPARGAPFRGRERREGRRRCGDKDGGVALPDSLTEPLPPPASHSPTVLYALHKARPQHTLKHANAPRTTSTLSPRLSSNAPDYARAPRRALSPRFHAISTPNAPSLVRHAGSAARFGRRRVKLARLALSFALSRHTGEPLGGERALLGSPGRAVAPFLNEKRREKTQVRGSRRAMAAQQRAG